MAKPNYSHTNVHTKEYECALDSDSVCTLVTFTDDNENCGFFSKDPHNKNADRGCYLRKKRKEPEQIAYEMDIGADKIYVNHCFSCMDKQTAENTIKKIESKSKNTLSLRRKNIKLKSKNCSLDIVKDQDNMNLSQNKEPSHYSDLKEENTPQKIDPIILLKLNLACKNLSKMDESDSNYKDNLDKGWEYVKHILKSSNPRLS